MTAPPLFVGIDISKKRLDVALNPGDQTFSCPHTEAGIQKLVRRLQGLKPQIILLEVPGGAAGIAAKTDRLDSRVLALYACRL